MPGHITEAFVTVLGFSVKWQPVQPKSATINAKHSSSRDLCGSGKDRLHLKIRCADAWRKSGMRRHISPGHVRGQEARVIAGVRRPD